MTVQEEHLSVDNQGISFETDWPEDLDLDLICINAEFEVKTSDGKCTVDIKGGKKLISTPNLGSIV